MKKGELTRQRIIELAAPLFNQRGLAGCSMGDIMEATGLEKGGIYRYFASKEALAAEAFSYAVQQTSKLRTEGVPGEEESGPLARLYGLIERFVSRPSALAGGCALLNTAVDSDDGSPVLRALAHKGFNDWRRRLMTTIRQAVRAGELDPACSPAELADTVIATLEGALVLCRLDGNRRALVHAQRSLERLLAVHGAARVPEGRRR